MVSVVLPVFNERDNLVPLLNEISGVMEPSEYEVIAVDDGSTDGSLQELKRLEAQYCFLRIVTLETHAGQSAAFEAGFQMATGDLIVTMDADGQNSPGDVRSMVDMLRRDPDLEAVVGFRCRRTDSRWKRVQSAVANSVRNWLTRDNVRDTGCSLKVMRRETLEAIPRFNGMHRFYPTLIRLQGGRVVEVPVVHRRRMSGKSKYGMWDRLFVGLYDALGVRWLSRRALRYRIRKEVR